MRRYIFLSILFISLMGCNSDDDDRIDCSTVLCEGRPLLSLELVNSDTNELYFQDFEDTVGPAGLELTRDDSQASLVFGQGYFIDNSGVLHIFQFPETVTISLENEFEVTLATDITTLPTDGCCPSYRIENTEASAGTLELLNGDEAFLFRLAI